MREWNLQSGDPLHLTLASDARLQATDYVNDHIWELSFRAGEPPALVLQTTFGLRARAFRIFPRFCQDDLSIIDPKDFKKAPTIRQAYPGLIELYFSPFQDIDVTAQYWVPGPQSLVGVYAIANNNKKPVDLRIELLAQLNPTEGQRMAPIEYQAAWVLAGETSGLHPVVFLSGGASFGAGSFPSLMHCFHLEPGESKLFTWAQAATDSFENSFDQARLVSSLNIAAAKTYLEMIATGQVEIYTGNPDWDAAFMLSQKQANSLLAGPTKHLPFTSFVAARQPDHGYSLRNDGSDYNHLWNGQSPLDTLYLCQFFFPGSPEIPAGLLRNYLIAQDTSGSIDWKPGLGGQRSLLLVTPVLAHLAWLIYQHNKDILFLEEVFPKLENYLQVWLSPIHDRDGDGIPEWDHPMQTGIEDHPNYSQWIETSLNVAINTAETPGLSAFLFNEFTTLARIAETIHMPDKIREFEAIAERMRLATEISWDDDLGIYLDVDRDTHYSTPRQLIAEGIGPGMIWINQKFDNPIRLQIQIATQTDQISRPHLTIHGTSASGKPRLEQVTADIFKWKSGFSHWTGDRVYRAIEFIEVHDLNPSDRIQIASAGYRYPNQTCLLPLWAGIPDVERAGKLIHGNILQPGRFSRPYGIGMTASPTPDSPSTFHSSIDLIWNELVSLGLLHYGFRQEAAELYIRTMKAIIVNLKSSQTFFRYYHAETGQGIGQRGALGGLAPVGLFLQLLGIKIYSTNQVFLSGFNPFPWPVTVKYRGMAILCKADKTTVIFPNGQEIEITDPAGQMVTLEKE